LPNVAAYRRQVSAVFRTREFNEQPQPDDFGAISISLAL
jgi:hypothetical protein